MRLRSSVWFLLVWPAMGQSPWAAILSSVGLPPPEAATSRVTVAPPGSAAAPEWPARVEQGTVLILEGESPLAAEFGFRRGESVVPVASITDIHRPDLSIVWERAVDLPVFEVPSEARVFGRERWSGAPVMAGFRRGAGAVLWVAASPGERGYERFPYLLQSLCDLGLEAPFRSGRLWAFFDSSYRLRVDLDYFAARWRKAGISALHVAAWHYYEPNQDRDAYLVRLIDACHREGIQVYAWLELPHVSERFWQDHPEWREKTALQQDAELDWRKLMNLANRECFRAVSAGVSRLVDRFDWDGVNLAELYFESLQGTANPSRFTPMNQDVRAEFRREHSFDPIEIFSSSMGARKDAASREAFLAYRSDLARRVQEEWIGEMEKMRAGKPYLDLVLTHVDDRFDTGMREAIGADAARVLPLAERHAITFLIEDPATVWHLGPQRYQTIAERYRPLTAEREKLAIDINIVERYQNVYPTKQQTGIELMQLIHNAAANFRRVALYFENSLGAPDLDLLPAAAAPPATVEQHGAAAVVNSAVGVGLGWKGPAKVDGAPWPVADGETVWLPKGLHRLEPADTGVGPGLRLLRLNGDLEAARVISGDSLEFSYTSGARAIAVLDRPVDRVEVDGVQETVRRVGANGVFLPRGRHSVRVSVESR